MAKVSPSWLLTCGAVAVAFASGSAMGFILGQRSGKSSNEQVIVEARTPGQASAERVRSLEEQLRVATRGLAQEKERAEAAVRDRDSKVAAALTQATEATSRAKIVEGRLATLMPDAKKSKPSDPRPAGEPDAKEQNDLVLAFIDNSAEFAGRELTARVRYGDRGKYLRMESKLQDRVSATWDKDRNGNDLVPFFGQSEAAGGAKIDLVIGVPVDLAAPNASPGDEVLVTFKCGSHPKAGNVAVRISRPKR